MILFTNLTQPSMYVYMHISIYKYYIYTYILIGLPFFQKRVEASLFCQGTFVDPRYFVPTRGSRFTLRCKVMVHADPDDLGRATLSR